MKTTLNQKINSLEELDRIGDKVKFSHSILRCILIAKKYQQKARENKKTIKNKRLKMYIDLLLQQNTLCGMKGYMIMTDNEFKFATGIIEEMDLKTALSGKKMMVSISDTGMSLIPLR